MTIWDRYDLDTAFENIKFRTRNTVAVALGLEPDDGPLPTHEELRAQIRAERKAQRERDEQARELKRQIKKHREERRKPVEVSRSKNKT
ncbi:UNVERIFIED_ORG: hypothetical protein M2425_002728 [Bradyrhizobium japonicum]